MIKDISKESSNSKDSKKMKEMKAKVTKLKAKVVNDKAAGNDKKETVYDKKASETRLEAVQSATPSIIMNPGEEALKVKVSLLPSFLLV